MTRSSGSRRALLIAVQVAVGAAFLWYAGTALYGQWAAVRDRVAAIDVHWGLVTGSALLVLGAYAVLIQTWRFMLHLWDAQLEMVAAARIWFVSNLGRYVPGKVWQVSAMGVMAHRRGVSAVAATGSSIIVNLANIISGALVVFATGATVLDVAARSGQVVAAGLIVLSLAVLLLTPRLLPWIARRAETLTGRQLAVPRSLTPRLVMVAVSGTAAAWILYGFAFQLFARGVLGGAAGGRSADYIAVYTASYLVGYLALFAPGGIGVREAMLVIALGMTGVTSEPNGWILALSSRLWLTALEVLPGALFLLAGVRPRAGETNASS